MKKQRRNFFAGIKSQRFDKSADRLPNSKRLLELYRAAYWICIKLGFTENAQDCAQYVMVKVLEGTCEWSSARQLVIAYLREEFAYGQKRTCRPKYDFLRQTEPGRSDIRHRGKHFNPVYDELDDAMKGKVLKHLSENPFEAVDVWLDLKRLSSDEIDERQVTEKIPYPPRPYCQRGHALHHDNLIIQTGGIRDGRISCSTCQTARTMKHRAKLRLKNYQTMEFVYYDAFNAKLIVAPYDVTDNKLLYLSEL